MRDRYTNRGFDLVEFEDAYDQRCSLQKSSLVDPHIWLGVDNTGPRLLGPNGGPNEQVNARMHLTPEQVEKLLPYLLKFVETGEIRD